MSVSLLSMLSFYHLPAIIFLLAIYTTVKPSEASNPSGAIKKRENVIEAADLQSGRAARSFDVTTLIFEAPRDTRGAHGGHRRKKYYSSRRIYRRRHLHSHTSDAYSDSDSFSSSESVSDSDETTGRRSKSSAKRNQKHESFYNEIMELHNEDQEEKWQYGYMPVRRGDLMQLLRVADHSHTELGPATVFVVDADFLRDVALSNATSPSGNGKLQHDLV